MHHPLGRLWIPACRGSSWHGSCWVLPVLQPVGIFHILGSVLLAGKTEPGAMALCAGDPAAQRSLCAPHPQWLQTWGLLTGPSCVTGPPPNVLGAENTVIMQERGQASQALSSWLSLVKNEGLALSFLLPAWPRRKHVDKGAVPVSGTAEAGANGMAKRSPTPLSGGSNPGAHGSFQCGQHTREVLQERGARTCVNSLEVHRNEK